MILFFGHKTILHVNLYSRLSRSPLPPFWGGGWGCHKSVIVCKPLLTSAMFFFLQTQIFTGNLFTSAASVCSRMSILFHIPPPSLFKKHFFYHKSSHLNLRLHFSWSDFDHRICVNASQIWPFFTLRYRRLTFTWWGCYGLCLWHKPTELARSCYSVLVSVPVLMALSTVFHSVKSPDNSPLSHSILLVLFLP